eukprot:1179783-Prorocentrum_minimum.AAC.1
MSKLYLIFEGAGDRTDTPSQAELKKAKTQAYKKVYRMNLVNKARRNANAAREVNKAKKKAYASSKEGKAKSIANAEREINKAKKKTNNAKWNPIYNPVWNPVNGPVNNPVNNPVYSFKRREARRIFARDRILANLKIVTPVLDVPVLQAIALKIYTEPSPEPCFNGLSPKEALEQKARGIYPGMTERKLEDEAYEFLDNRGANTMHLGHWNGQTNRAVLVPKGTSIKGRS